MKLFTILFLLFFNVAHASPDEVGGPGNHLKLEDFKTLHEAKNAFLKNNALINKAGSLDSEDVHKIHVITYRLEKSLELFLKHTKGEKHQQISELAVVLEELHEASEHNDLNSAETKLKAYLNKVDQMLFGF